MRLVTSGIFLAGYCCPQTVRPVSEFVPETGFFQYSKKMQLLKQGAEAKVYITTHNDNPTIAKERLVKSYRLPELDTRLSKARIKQEVRCLKVCRENGISAPEVYHVDTANRMIYMQLVNGPSLRDFIIDKVAKQERQVILDLAKKLGKILTRIHALNMVHGDLTTSNILVDESGKELVMIDFGLAFTTTSVEDKVRSSLCQPFQAVDLYVLERALSSTHPDSHDIVCFERIIRVV